MDDNGNLTICGTVADRARTQKRRTVIDGNGIKSYNEKNQLHGLVSNLDKTWGDLNIFYNGKEIFRVCNEGAGSVVVSCISKEVIRLSDIRKVLKKVVGVFVSNLSNT